MGMKKITPKTKSSAKIIHPDYRPLSKKRTKIYIYLWSPGLVAAALIFTESAKLQ